MHKRPYSVLIKLTRQPPRGMTSGGLTLAEPVRGLSLTRYLPLLLLVTPLTPQMPQNFISKHNSSFLQTCQRLRIPGSDLMPRRGSPQGLVWAVMSPGRKAPPAPEVTPAGTAAHTRRAPLHSRAHPHGLAARRLGIVGH